MNTDLFRVPCSVTPIARVTEHAIRNTAATQCDLPHYALRITHSALRTPQ